MKNSLQINELFEIDKIQKLLIESFEKILGNISENELDIIDKNIHINSIKIKYRKTKNNFHSFQSPIIKMNTEIGYYSLVYDNNLNQIDEYFVIK